MAHFREIQEYIALDANITLVFDSGNIVNISGNIFLYPPQGHPILYNYCMVKCLTKNAESHTKRAPQNEKFWYDVLQINVVVHHKTMDNLLSKCRITKNILKSNRKVTNNNITKLSW